ncbi:MAG: nucleotide exchange factor GrpE [Planctomycetes bacterium]|nr:nucleotide exchange factor GrpE [Planctomycetota bacterium]
MNADVVETILADFRAWLLEASEIPRTEPVSMLDVATIVQHFTALRQEVNLQTRATRSQLDQNADMLAALQQAMNSLQEAPTDAEDGSVSDDEAIRPLLKTLVDAHDALSLAYGQVQRLLDQPPVSPAASSPPTVKLRLPFWAHWLGLAELIEEQMAPLRTWRPAPDESLPRFRQALEALLVGYRMSMQRIERALEQQELEPIDCVGKPFDPELMEVAEVVSEEGRASTEVIQEIRRGYRWRGKLFRYAQVRVAKP